jgi:HAD superfamily hydrolase (TIGR01509 family)
VTDILLLDYNGVLVDDEPLHGAAFFAVLAEEGLPLSREDYYAEYLGMDDRACFRLALNRDGRPIVPGDVGHLVERKRARYLALAEQGLPLVAGAAAFVREAARRWPVAVVSGATRREIALGLARAGIADVVRAVVSCDDTPTSKPDPAGFRLALARLSAAAPDPCRAAIAEDSLPGLAAARALGAGCLMLATTHPAATLAGADLVWTSFDGHHPAELEPLFREVAVDRRV